MKQVINGKLYDTDKSKNIADWDDGKAERDYVTRMESLYVSSKGTYFLEIWEGFLPQNEGMTATVDAVYLKVVSQEDTMKWLEEKSFHYELIDYFSDKLEEG